VTGDYYSETFRVHKEPLRSYSAYFEAALRGHFKEGNKGLIKLEDVKPSRFYMLLTWVNTQGVMQHQHHFQPERQELIELWLLADRFLMPDLQNSTLDLLDADYVRTGMGFLPADIRFVYKNTSYESKLWQYVIARGVDEQMDAINRDRPKYPVETLDLTAYPAELVAELGDLTMKCLAIQFDLENNRSKKPYVKKEMETFYVKHKKVSLSPSTTTIDSNS
jgi:hypothetical protein